MAIGRKQRIRLRKDARMPVTLAASLVHDGCPLTIRLIDLSRRGASAEMLRPAPVRASVTLNSGTLEIQARILWVEERHVGLLFKDRIRATDLLSLMAKGREAPA